MEGVLQFVREATSALRGSSALNGRARHLLAVPLVGTGAGGGGAIKGDVVRLLVETLTEAAAESGVDIVLVTNTGSAFAAAQSARRQLIEAGHRWGELGPTLTSAADGLAADALAGRLVLFLGAGVGVGAGLPAWGDLLDRLAKVAGVGAAERAAMRDRLTPTDRALLVERRLATMNLSLGEAVADQLRGGRCSLAHQLLAGLPVSEAATMNYDALFETAWRAAGRSPAVLPYQPAADRDSWLLKMHGTLESPADIVPTRDDYLRYAERRAALAGIVQALLITRRMLFVGFSLSDENFHRIAHDVRQALGSSAEKTPFGTALLLRREPLMQELWRGDVDCVALTDDASGPEAGRLVEVFLDYLLLRASSNADHLLDPAYAGVLTPAESAMREHLERFVAEVPGVALESAAWVKIEGLLRRFGWQASPD